MKIRFFNTYEPVTTFYRDLLPYLARQGMVSEVLISAAEYRKGGRERLSEALKNERIRVRYLPTFGMLPATRWQKVGIMLVYMLSSMVITLVGHGADINFFMTQPPLFSLWGLVLKILRRQPYICLVMDLYPDVAIRSGLLREKSIWTKLLTEINKLVLTQANAVVVIGRCQAQRIQDMGVFPDKIYVIQNWANTDIIYSVPRGKNILRKELSLHDKFVVLYSGNMGISHDFSDILEVAHRFQSQPEVHFVFIGDGVRRTEIETFIQKNNMMNVSLLPFQPLEKLAESLCLGDVHFVSLRKGFEGLVVPSKTYGALASGRPVIYSGMDTGEIARMLHDYDVGTVVQPGDVEGLYQAIERYWKDVDLRNRQGEKAQKVIAREMEKNRALEQYKQLFFLIGGLATC